MESGLAKIRTIIAPLKGPGRCAPALLEDLTLYDPRTLNAHGRNLLRDSLFNFTDTTTVGEALPENSCRHVFALKERQSILPAVDEVPGPETVWIVAAFCQKCRIHLSLKVDYTEKTGSSPCPNAEHPLHHLIYTEWRQSSEANTWLKNHPGSPDEIYSYECSSNDCPVTVTVHLSPPIMADRSVHILVDKKLLHQRTEEAFKMKEGNTEGMKHPQPIDVLTDLRAYIRNAWKEDQKFRNINVTNRRFIVRFGIDGAPCRAVLEELHFKHQPGECWQIPEPNRDESLPYRSNINLFMDNAEHELNALILDCSEDQRQLTQDRTSLVPAENEFARVMGTQDYDKHLFNRNLKIEPATRPRHYVVLGATQDLADRNILFCYHMQIFKDHRNTPYYLKALKSIASERESESLQTEAVMETSNGKFDIDELVEAYKYFGLYKDQEGIDDDYILGLFSSRLEDSPSHEHDMRNHLRMIGIDRSSSKIVQTAENTMNTYEQALQFLGADDAVSDDAIQALFAVKVNDNKTLEEQAIKAVKMVAQHRNSVLLNSWISSGFTSDMHMDATEGYQALQIDNRTVDDDLIITQYDVIVQDNPTSIEYYNKALRAIADERNSSALRDHLRGMGFQPGQGSSDEPVGLDNIGNTCYLNSLLQYLFTIVELRQVVLDFEKFKMELNETNMLQKKVGRRRVTRREVDTAQKFVTSLGFLFKGMIETPQSAIRPQQELARLTLETDSAKEKIRRRSTMMSDRPSLGHVDSQQYPGPLQIPNLQPSAIIEDVVMQSPGDAEPISNPIPSTELEAQDELRDANASKATDDSSEATLVSRPGSEGSPAIEIPTAEQQQAMFDNKENISPNKVETSPKRVEFEDQEVVPLRPASPSKLNVQAGVLASKDGNTEASDQIIYQPPPGKPPPVPPRRPVETSTDIIEEYARQQDVTEVMSHCLFQFSCAMRPTGVDKSGEQLDEIHDLFYGQNISHDVPETETPSSVQFSSIITRVAHEPNDVYAALDSEYDLQVRDDGSKAFLSIANLPPIFGVALDRVIWDKQANRPAKLNHHIGLLEIIFLDRYIESPAGSDLMQRRMATWALKTELARLNERRKILEQKHAQSRDLPELFADAKFVLEHLQTEVPEDDGFGGSLNVNPHVITTLGLLAEETQAELDHITARIKHLHQQIKEAFVDMRKHPYRLHAAFFHRGSAGGGHYWVYIYDHKKEVWRRYNDDRVNVVENRNEIFGKPEQNSSAWGAPPNPYFLVYVREDQLDQIVESVKRDIVHPPPTEAPPILARNQMSEMPPGVPGFALNTYPGPLGGGDVPMHNAGNGSYYSDDDGPNPMIEPLL